MSESTHNDESYAARMRQEIAFFENLLKGKRTITSEETWTKVEARFSELMQASVGVPNLYEYVARWAEGKRKHVTILGLGSGTCGNELEGIAPLLRQRGITVELTCIDINEAILVEAGEESKKHGVEFHGIVQDVNRLTLEPESFDVIVAYAALHHFLELEHVAAQINSALVSDGLFVTVDIPTRNGYLMWDETYEVVDSIWGLLPERFKISHTSQATPVAMERIENIDYSVNSFECINSEAIMPAIRRHLFEVDYLPAFAFARRFLDTMFGPNYDLSRPLDRAIFDYIIQLDDYYVTHGLLPPETFFGAYRKRRPEDPPAPPEALEWGPSSGFRLRRDEATAVEMLRLREKVAELERTAAEIDYLRSETARLDALASEREAQLRALTKTKFFRLMSAYWRLRGR